VIPSKVVFREEAAMKISPDFIVKFCLGALLVWGAAGICASAQEQAIKCDKVPAAVTSAFKTAYPKATIRDCSKEIEKGKTAYELSSIEDKTRRDILYHEDGTVIVVEEAIPEGDLPEPVRLAISKKYPKGPITLAERLTRDSTVSYEVRLKHRGKLLELVYSPDGKEEPQ
jgi:Putative beta-lactamase-inhibitor-like, PepSY-like